MLGMIETGDMFHGRFIEVHVGRVLGADVSDSGVNGWDLWLDDQPPITIEVKATAAGGTYRLRRKPKRPPAAGKPPRIKGQVWVFVAYANKSERPRQFSYVVVPRSTVDAMPNEVRQAGLFEQFGPPVAEDQLFDRVREVAALSRGA
jgi:hypothetical protein